MRFGPTFKKYFTETVCILYVFLFTYATVSKLVDFRKFTVQLGQSPILTTVSGWVAWIIPTIEIVLSLLLFFPQYRLKALYGCFSLMVMFSAYIVAITKYSEYIPCSCGGVLQNMTWNQHLLFNIAFVLLAMISILIYPTGPKYFIAIESGETENLKKE